MDDSICFVVVLLANAVLCSWEARELASSRVQLGGPSPAAGIRAITVPRVRFVPGVG